MDIYGLPVIVYSRSVKVYCVSVKLVPAAYSMHNAILVSLFVVVLSSVMFSKLVTPSKEQSKATLRDFVVQITPEKEPPSVTFNLLSLSQP